MVDPHLKAANGPAARHGHLQHDYRTIDAPTTQPSQRFVSATSRDAPSSVSPSIDTARSFPVVHHSATIPQNIITEVGHARSEDRRCSRERSHQEPESPSQHSDTDFGYGTLRASGGHASPRYTSQKKQYNQDEFDGPSQLLRPPSPRSIASHEQRLPELPINLNLREQDEIVTHLNDILSQCAFHFVAKYSFPIPLDRRPANQPDRVGVPAQEAGHEEAYPR